MLLCRKLLEILDCEASNRKINYVIILCKHIQTQYLPDDTECSSNITLVFCLESTINYNQVSLRQINHYNALRKILLSCCIESFTLIPFTFLQSLMQNHPNCLSCLYGSWLLSHSLWNSPILVHSPLLFAFGTITLWSYVDSNNTWLTYFM